ncbi:two-component regulator propeller domain-containing protein [Puia sp. P3]|uniref:two-component regulator propeller domain-containing protein n=1 Tax=Puia sp. P3 TaxID=3423952 RepID=UPI003D666BBC
MAGGPSVEAQSTRAAPFHGSFVSRNIDVVNGLMSNNVLSIAQDKKGFVWIGTDKGMQRYDGLRFVTCNLQGTSPNALDVPAIYPDDAQGRILYRRADDSLWQWDPLRHTAAPVATPPVSSKDLVYTDQQGKHLTIRPVWKDGDVPQKNGLVLVHEEGGDQDKPATYLRDSARGRPGSSSAAVASSCWTRSGGRHWLLRYPSILSPSTPSSPTGTTTSG